MTGVFDKPAGLFAKHVRTTRSDSLISRYYAGVRLASERLGRSDSTGFAPAFEYPDLTDTWERFFDVAKASWHPLEDYNGSRLSLLDLMRNPATRTTKTVASLLMVARAVHHIRRSGEKIMIFTPSSGNKAVALRDAVARALRLGLATPDELRIVTLTPADTLYKFRRNELTESMELRSLNPLLVYPDEDRAAVKDLGRDFVRTAANSDGQRLWYSLHIENYKVADACRAFFEYEFGTRNEGRRLHAHAVSSAYGLLGYQHGLNVLAELGVPTTRPGFLLIQHLGTPDMVQHYLREGLGADIEIEYQIDPLSGLLRQKTSRHFPYETWSADEDLEPTFYTKAPPTSAEMTGLIVKHGGSGIVVSLHECIARYSTLRRLLTATESPLPEDPRRLAEWSLVMAITGVLNAIDRELISDFKDIVVHGSGMYLYPDSAAVHPDQTVEVKTSADMLSTIQQNITALSC